MKTDKFLENRQDLLLFRAFDASPDFTIFANESGDIVYSNPQSLIVVGYTPSEITHSNIELLIPERYRVAHLNHIQAYFANPKQGPIGRELNLTLLHKDGTELRAEIRLSPLATEQGRLVICAIREISNRNKIETAFLGDERFRLFMKHTTSAVAMFDNQMRYLAVSERWLEAYRLKNKEILGLCHYEVFPETPNHWKSIHQRCLAGEVLEAEEELFLSDDGEKDWVSWKIHPWYLDNGQIGGAILFSQVITERKKAELAIRESEQRFRGIFNYAVTGIALSDLAGHFLMANPAYCELLGYSAQELCQLEFVSIIHPDDRKADLALHASLIAGKRSFFEIENRYINKNNQTVWVNKRVSVLTDDDGRSTQLLVLATDISERKLNKEALRNSEALSSSILNSMISHIAVLDERGVIVAVNNAWQQFANENAVAENHESMLGVNYLDVCKKAFNQPSGEGASAAYVGISEVLAGKLKTFNLEYPCHAPDQQRWFYMNVTPLKGTNYGVVVSHENITDRMRLQEQLMVSESRYRSVVEDQTEVISRFLPDGIIVFVNDVYCRLFGKTAEELVGRTWQPLVYPDDVPLIEAKLREMSPDHPVVIIEKRVFGANGELVWMQFVNRGFYDVNGSVKEIQSVGRDITSLKQIEANLRESEETLQRAQEVGRIGSFAMDRHTEAFSITRETARLFDLDDTGITTFAEWFSRVHPDDQCQVETAWRAALQGAPYDMTYRIVVHGRICWIRALAELQFDAHGQLTNAVGTVQDISDLKQIEASLRESDERLDMALSGSELVLWDWNIPERKVTAGNRWPELLGYTFEELGDSESDWMALINPEDLETFNKKISVHLKGEAASFESEPRLRHRDGYWVSVEAKGKVTRRGKDGAPLRMVGTVQDITQRKRLKQEGEDLLKRIESLIQEISSGSSTKKKNSQAFDSLTKRESMILTMIAQGMTSAQIAKHLNLATSTVTSHRQNMMAKLDLHSTAEVVRFAIDHGMTTKSG